MDDLPSLFLFSSLIFLHKYIAYAKHMPMHMHKHSVSIGMSIALAYEI